MSYSTQYSSQVRRKEAVAAAKVRARGTCWPLQLPLSAVLAQAPSAFDGRRLTAVGKNVSVIDVLPERCASQVKTLYLSKNALVSLEGVQQFTSLRALSAADNVLADLEAMLGPLRSSGGQLEAANFEGNPVAELPNYRAHVLVALGPSLQMLDNRAVSPEERAAAPGAVAHEATMLALMLSNACLVHKLGRAVQLVRLHCELRAVVLGGHCGAAGPLLHDFAKGADLTKLLQLWDYEVTLNCQERHAILLAIRREVGRRYKRMVLAGAKLDGSAKSWQQAYAQVMLAQQETVAGLMKLLEDARAEAAAILRPLTRPASPMKLCELRIEQEADCRVKHEREALVVELRDAYLDLADASRESSPRRSTKRIRSLQEALQANGLGGQAQREQQQQQEWWRQHEREEEGGEEEDVGRERAARDWAIPAAHGRAGSAASSPDVSPSKQLLPRPKSALRQPATDGSPLRGCRITQGNADASPIGKPTGASAAARPASAPAVRRLTAIPKPLAQQRNSERPQLAGSEEPTQRQCSNGEPSPAQPEQPQSWKWQPDDGLAAIEHEAHRSCVPMPFRPRSVSAHSSSLGPAAPSREAAAAVAPVSRPQTAPAARPDGWRPAQGLVGDEGAVAPDNAEELPQGLPASSSWRSPGSPGSCPRLPSPLARTHSGASSHAAGATSPRPCSRSSWRANSLAAAGGPVRASSPMQNLVAVLAKEGEQRQIRTLQAALAGMEKANAQLQEANGELASSLQQVHQHAQNLEAQLAQEAARVQALVAEAECAKESRQQVQLETEAVLVRMERDGQQGQLATLQAEIQAKAAEVEAKAAEVEAKAAEVEALQHKVAELEGRDLIRVTLTVSFEAELNAELKRSAAFEARAVEAAAKLAEYQWEHQRAERLRCAIDALAGTSCLRRVFQRWRAAAAERASLAQLLGIADAAHRQQALRKWLGRWRLALVRSCTMAAIEQQQRAALVARAWASWRQHCHDTRLRRALEVAAQLHRRTVLLRQVGGAWRDYVVSQRQVEWSEKHPTLVRAAQLRRRRMLAAFSQAWRGWLLNQVKPKQAMLSTCKAHLFMGAQRRVWVAWKEYTAHRRNRSLLRAVADQHLLARHLRLWRQTVVEQKAERCAALRGAVTHRVLLQRRVWKAWREFLRMAQEAKSAKVIVSQHRKQVVLSSAWRCWQEWAGLSSELKKRQQLAALKAAFYTWKRAVRAAEQGRCAMRHYQRRVGMRWREAFKAWRQLVESKRQSLKRLAQAQEVLQRWHLARALATWRRGVLVCKLQRSLGLVQQLQAAIENVKEELQRKAAEIESLEHVKLTVESHAQSLSLRVTTLDSELGAAEKKAEELQAALEQAQVECATALAARDAAAAARDAAVAQAGEACSQVDAAEASRAKAVAQAVQAGDERDAAFQQASSAMAEREVAVLAREAAEAAMQAAQAAAAAAAAERDALAAERGQLAAELEQSQQEQRGLVTDLEQALGEMQRLGGSLDNLRQEHERLAAQHEAGVSERVLALAEKQAALKQAERLSSLLEAEERQCRHLQATVEDLQAQVSSLQVLDQELRNIAERSDALHAENSVLQAHLQDSVRMQANLDVAKAEGTKLAAALCEQQRQHAELALSVEQLQAAQHSLKVQLAHAQSFAEQLSGDKSALSQVVARLQTERKSLVETVAQVTGEKQGMEAQLTKLREQVQQSSAALAGCATGFPGPAPTELKDLPGSAKAALLEKDTALRALAQDNCDRASRMRTLQSQVDQLSRQVLGGSSTRHPQPIASGLEIPAGSRLGSPALSSDSSAACGSAQRRMPTPQPSSPGSAGRASQAATLAVRLSLSPSSNMPAQQPSPAYSPGANGVGVASRLQPQPPGTAYSPAATSPASSHYFAASFAPVSSTPSTISGSAVPTAAEGTLQCRLAARHFSSPTATLDKSSPLHASAAPLGNAYGGAAPARDPASQYCSDSGPAALAAFCTYSPSSANTDQRLRELRAAAAAGLLPVEVSEQRLSFLLELVVQKRVSAAEAQQVIKAAGEGDARPLLRVLDSVKRRVQQGDAGTAEQPAVSSPQHPSGSPTQPLPPQRQGFMPQGALSPGSASELMAVRRQIQQLQSSIQAGQQQ